MMKQKTSGEIVHKTSAWIKFFYAGVTHDTFTKDIRRIFIINLFSTVGIIFMLPLGIDLLLHGDLLIGSFLLVISFLYTLNHFYLRYTHNYSVSGSFLIYPLYCLMLYLIYTGGVDDTGHVWIFCIPAVSLFLHGMKQGLIELGVFTLALIAAMYFMDSHFAIEAAHGHDSLRPRVLCSFLVVVFLSGIYEYSMSRSNDDLEEASNKLKLVAYVDSLTALLNRRGILQKLEANESDDFHLVLADVDYFKRINDEYGHDVGDYALTEVANIIKKSLPQGSFASRWGGEEFLVALPCHKNSVGGQAAYDLAEQIRKDVESHRFVYLDWHFSVTLSFGVASMNEKTTLREAITLADSCLYMAKRDGRNQVHQMT